MFDANARYLEKGTLFFASCEDDLWYCEMLEDDHEDPKVKIITSYKGVKPFLYKSGSDWTSIVFEGYYEDGVLLLSFIDPDEKDKAIKILERLHNV